MIRIFLEPVSDRANALGAYVVVQVTISMYKDAEGLNESIFE